MSSSILKPGELRILEALEEGPLADKELKEKARLVNPNRRIQYLRHLWKRGLITRDIGTRKYLILDKGREVLRLMDRMRILLGKDKWNVSLYQPKPKDGVDISRGKVDET